MRSSHQQLFNFELIISEEQIHVFKISLFITKIIRILLLNEYLHPKSITDNRIGTLETNEWDNLIKVLRKLNFQLR